MANLCHQIKIRIPGILYRMHGRCCILFEAKSIVSWIIGGSESSSLSIVPNQVYIVQGCQGFFRGCQTHSGHRFPFRSTDEIFNDLRRMQDSIRFNRSKWNPNHVRMLGILQRMSDSQSPPFFFFFWIWDEIIRGSSKKSSLSIVPNNNSIVEGCQGFFRGCRTSHTHTHSGVLSFFFVVFFLVSGVFVVGPSKTVFQLSLLITRSVYL